MIRISPVSEDIVNKAQKCGIFKKFQKQCLLLSKNYRHPSLHAELLEPKEYGIYSFRIDQKYRALFFFNPKINMVEIIAITLHYR